MKRCLCNMGSRRIGLKDSNMEPSCFLTRQERYWQGDSRADLDEMVTFSLTFGKRIAGNQIEVLGTVPITRRMRSRVLQQTDPIMGGDDVMMLQSLLTFLGWELGIDGAFGPGTASRVLAFRKQNIYGATSIQIGNKELELLHAHFDDYRWALNAFGWDNGDEPVQQSATVGQEHPLFKRDSEEEEEEDRWIEEAAAEIEHLKSGIITPDPAWSTDERDLLLAVIWKESSGTHWDNWEVTISPQGALGFLQIMSYNSKRYNSLGTLPASLNLYRPDDNLKQAAYLLEEYSVMAFGDHANQSDGWQVSGDDDVDVLAKILARYNGGDESIHQNNTWETICKDELVKEEDDPDPLIMSSRSRKNWVWI